MSDLTGRVALVTGAGGGIGAEVAREFARRGAFVVANDNGSSLDGTEIGEATAQATAELIAAAGGHCVADSTSVTDRAALQDLVDKVSAQHGSIDVVVNLAGNIRTAELTASTELDWQSVLDCHLGGHLNSIGAVAPIMIANRFGRIVNVTSGAGLARPVVESPMYSAAKRSVAALTWEFGATGPIGVTMNALSPIAFTRMITGTAPPPPDTASSAPQLDFSGMPAPQRLAPGVAHLATDAMTWSAGQVIFVNGSELAHMAPPLLVDVVESSRVEVDRSHDMSAARSILLAAQAAQLSAGGGMPRMGVERRERSSSVARVVVVTSPPPGRESPVDAVPITRALVACGANVRNLEVSLRPGARFDEALDALAAAERELTEIDAVVILTGASPAPASGGGSWPDEIERCRGAIDDIVTAAAWSRAAHLLRTLQHAPVRVVHVTAAHDSAGRVTAQAVAQMVRAIRTTGVVGAPLPFAIAVEEAGVGPALGDLVTDVVIAPESAALSTAALVVGREWVGIRSNPRAERSITFAGPQIPEWATDALRR